MAELNATEKVLRNLKRRTFALFLGVAFLLSTIAAWWIVPTFAKTVHEIGTSTGADLPAIAVTFLRFSTIFKFAYWPIAAACVVLGVLGAKGGLDPFLWLLNTLLVLFCGALVLICFIAVFMPTITMANAVR